MILKKKITKDKRVFFPIAHFLGGALSLYIGAEILVYGSASLALRLKIPLLIIGLTVIAFGTSSPELFVNIYSALHGFGDLTLGNLVGANILSLSGVIGLSALIKPIHLSRQLLRWDIPFMMASTLLVMIFSYEKKISRFDGAIFVVFLLIYLFVLYMIGKKSIVIEEEITLLKEETKPSANKRSSTYLWADILMVLVGIVLLFFGGRWLVKGALGFAQAFLIGQGIVGLTIVAFGTTLPEMVTCVVAIFRKKRHIAIGTAIGSNTFNFLGILGFSSLARPLHFQHDILIDLIGLLALQGFLFPLLLKKQEIPRWKGGILIAFYAFYVAFLFILKPA
jgi:cation:H+ antiporter